MTSPLPSFLEAYYFPLVGDTMLELGNKKTNDITYKQYFKSLGINHVSIDINGKDGALPLDLRYPIDMEPFDMVTNIGTTEHVTDQEGVWRNIHNLCKTGGVIVSHTPLQGDWTWHGIWFPLESFYTQFASINGYKIEKLDIEGEEPKRTINVRMKKVKQVDFTMISESAFYCNEKME